MLSKSTCWVGVVLALWMNDAAAKTNLLQVLQQAYDNDPQFHAKESTWQSQQQQALINRSSLLLQLAASTQSTAQSIPSDGDSSSAQNSSIGLSLRQSLINVADWQGYQRAKIEAKASQIEYAAALQDLIKRTSEAYFDVLKVQNQLQLNQKAVDNDARLLQWTKARFDSGLAKSVDVDTAQAVYQQNLVTVVDAKKALREKLAHLQTITGNEEQSLASLHATVPFSKPVPLDLAAWEHSLQENNLTVRAEQYRLQAQRTNIQVQHAGHYPTLEASADVNRSTTTTSPFANGGTNKQVTLTLSVPIYSGGKTSAQTLKATYDYQTSLEKYRQRYREQLEQLQDSYEGVLLGVDKLRADAQMVAANQQALRSTQTAYENGISNTNMSVLITAQQALYASQQQLFSDQCEYLVNSIKLKQAAGLLSMQDVTQLNDWLQ